MTPVLPRVLIIDDLFGRTLPDRRNEERAHLCAYYLLKDVTGDQPGWSVPHVPEPVAQAVFCRGQRPVCASVGDVLDNDVEGALAAVREGWGPEARDRQRWAMVLLDLCFLTGRVTPASHEHTPGMPAGRPADEDAKQYFGLQLLRLLREHFPELPVAVFSSRDRQEVGAQFVLGGAVAFLERDRSGAEGLRQLLWRHGLLEDYRGILVGRDPAFLSALRDARQAAETGDCNVLLCGPSGTGKELFARYLHDSSPKAPGPFRILFPAGTAASIFEDQLFGHVKGAFTDAREDRAGLAELADGGTLFIDECGEIDGPIQGKFLRLLDRNLREAQRQGSPITRRLNLQVILATSRDLRPPGFPEYIREDIRRRITTLIHLPSLRERESDIPLLAEFFIRKAEAGSPDARTRVLLPETAALLQEYSWPGNIGELEEVIRKAVQRFPDVEYLAPDHLRLHRPMPVDNGPAGSMPIIALRSGQANLDDLLRTIESAGFPMDQVQDWKGRFPDLRAACARLLVRYLRAALAVTTRVTLDQPSGKVLINPALKLLTGDPNCNASQAADLIKRIVGYDECANLPVVEADSLLWEAYQTALRLRPSRPPKKAP